MPGHTFLTAVSSSKFLSQFCPGVGGFQGHMASKKDISVPF